MNIMMTRNTEELNSIAIKYALTSSSAHRRGKEFNLSMQYIRNVMRQGHCAYSGEAFGDLGSYDGMTFERLDGDKGYVLGNVIPVKRKYNELRANLTQDELRQALKQAKEAAFDDSGVDYEERARAMYAKSYLHIQKMEDSYNHHEQQLELRRASLIRMENSNKVNKAYKALVIKDEIKNCEARQERRMSEIEKCKSALDTVEEIRDRMELKASLQRSRIHDLEVLIEAIPRLQNASKADKLRMELGLPLNASKVKVIMNKVGL